MDPDTRAFEEEASVGPGGAPHGARLRLRDHPQGPRCLRNREVFGINFYPSHFAHQFLTLRVL